MAVLVLFSFLFISTVTGILWNAECPIGWLPFQGNCFLFVKYRDTWLQATEVCHLHHGRMATAYTRDRTLFYKMVIDLNQYNETVWLGGTDDLNSGQWVWAGTDDPFTYDNWAPGEPNSLTRDHCLTMYNKHNFKWADENCSKRYQFICERKASGSFVTTTVASGAGK